MGNLTNVNRCSQGTFDSIAEGTFTEAYDDNALYAVELEEPVILGGDGSNTHIDENNNLIADIPNMVYL